MYNRQKRKISLCKLQIAYIIIYAIIVNRKEVNTMSKRKRSGKVDGLTSYINLTASILNLLVALLILFEKLSG